MPGTSHGPRGRTGAAASSAAAAEAVRALASIVCATLGNPRPDPAAAPAADARSAAGHASPGMEAASAAVGKAGDPAAKGGGAGPGAAALASLEQLARKATDSQAAGPGTPGGSAPGGQPAAEQPRSQQNGHVGGVDAQGRATAAARGAAPLKPLPGFTGRFCVERDAAWRAASAQRLGPLMAKALPALCAHPSAAVRAALSRGALSLLLCRYCSIVL